MHIEKKKEKWKNVQDVKIEEHMQNSILVQFP